MNEPPGFSIGGAGTPTYGFAKMSKKKKKKQPKKSTKCWRAHPGANGLTCSKKHKLRKKIIKLEEMEPIIPGHRTMLQINVLLPREVTIEVTINPYKRVL